MLAYHNIVPAPLAGHGDASLHLPVDVLHTQLELARKEADLVDLPTLMRERERQGRRVAVTFDDAYVGCVEHGLPACTASGVVPTVFVAPDLLGTVPPWDARAQAGQWTPTDRSEFLGVRQGREAAERRPAWSDVPAEYRIATGTLLARAVRGGGVHIGNHSMSHANLASLSAAEVCDEIARSAAALATYGDAVVPFVAYPYGMAPAPEVRQLLRPYCEAAFLVEGDWLRAGTHADALALPRLNVPAGLSAAGFRVRLRGWSTGSALR